ncbi:MAG: hypothetical protein ACQEQM_05305 [Thermoplasmatota archaeon]
MKIGDLKKPEYFSKVIGTIFIVLSVYLFIFTEFVNIAFGSLFIGIITIVILHFKTVEKSTAESMLKSSVLPLNDLLTDLDLEGNGVYIPPGKNLSSSRTYIPAGDFRGLPNIYDEMTIITGGAGRTGISLKPLGAPILNEAKVRMESELDGVGIEGAREGMGILTHGLSLAKSFSFREEDGLFKLRITHDGYDNYCEELRGYDKKLCTRTGCPICSAYLTCASEGLKTPLRVVEFEKDGKHIKFILEEVS